MSTVEEVALGLVAEGILEASDHEIMEAARAAGVDVNALVRRVREMISQRLSGNEASRANGFGVGDTVALRSDPRRVGVITAVSRSNRETRYGVFIDGRVQSLYARQIQAADLTAAMVSVNLDELNARLSALQLTAPSLANLYSLQAGRIDFIPYQFRPVLKFISADRPRLLVADEVGVGKTIEAGLVLRELQARRPLRSVIIVCSKALVVEEKWHREMRRFDEEFVTLSGADL
jgi:ATP-dependent helicase HepA